MVLPDTVTEVGSEFLYKCGRVEVRSGSTAVQAAAAEHNKRFDRCSSLTTVVLPDTVTEVGSGFLYKCGRVEVRSDSTAVQAAAAEHNKQFDSD